MQRRNSLPVHLSSYLVIAIGAILYVIKNFFSVEGEWGVEDHFLVKPLLSAHLLTTPLLVFFIGSILHFHILIKLKSGVKKFKVSGLLLVVSFLVMLFSGTSIQVFISEAGRNTAVLIHNISALIWAISYILHHALVSFSKHTSN
ncbi:hypothetical protein [Bacteriovorax sp. Seq25_V]|uniref:hypothetical protein n=1 Tax=Bacteriovorax sp. Seq25_V TaxID=1201288 RepID=UPI000389EC1D|nr:hypothetical protein [Bacteriovorax sp. Seq25_V]EQC43744.1 hypothetical protein M900_1366 [Bacteriovorax sp. Seq25_V]